MNLKDMTLSEISQSPLGTHMRSLEEPESQRQKADVLLSETGKMRSCWLTGTVSVLQDESCIDWLHNSVDTLSNTQLYT